MNHFSFELSLIALIPGLFLCGYVFYKDRIEKEPLGLLALLFGAGAVAYIPAYLLQRLAVQGIDKLFQNSMSFSAEGYLTYSTPQSELFHNVLCACLGFALIPFCIKWLVLFFGTHKNRHFNYLFDGIVYAVFLSLGFAVAENAHFLLRNDTDLLIAKLMTSVPYHLFVAVLMGYYYTMWRLRFIVNRIEDTMLSDGIIQKDKIRPATGWLIASFVTPIVVGTLYTLAASLKETMAVTLFYTIVFLLYGVSFVAIHRIASREISSKHYLCRVIAKDHPTLSREQIESYVAAEEGR